MAKKISMEDVAKRLGISKNTVSLALRNMPGINEQTKNLILETANEIGYKYKKSNDALKNICLILSKSTRNSVGFFNFIQFGIEDEAKKNGINILIYYYDESNDTFEIPLSIKEGMISGIITLGRISRKTITTILTFNLPLVIVDHYFENLNLNYVLSDNVTGGYIATEYLIKNGCSNLGFIGDISASISFADRYLGFTKALSDNGNTYNSEYSFLISIENIAVHDPSLVVQEFTSRNSLPNGIFCCNDSEAIAVIKVLTSLGIKVPEDISIIGFDDIEFSRNMTPELTTMRVEKELMGKKAVKRLIAIMKDARSTSEKLLLSTRLIERKSVK